MIRVYLASPFFTDEQRSLVKHVASVIRSNPKYDVYVPMEHEIFDAWGKSNAEWAREVFQEDKQAIDNSDLVVVINWGMNVDTGTAWECGYACGTGKGVVELLAGNDKVYSLMMINSVDRLGSVFDGFISYVDSKLLTKIEQK